MRQNVYIFMLKFTDTHSHLYLSHFNDDIEAVIARAEKVLQAVYLPNIDMKSVSAMLELTAQKPNFFFPMIGLHPCSVNQDFLQVLEAMETMLIEGNTETSKTWYGIGETGIDMHWDKTKLEIQKEALSIQIEWAKKYQLPIILHCREALDIVIEMIEKAASPELSGIFHCFDGTEAQAYRISQIPNFKMGVGGIITYKTTTLIRTIANIGVEHLVLETDSPFLPPTPHRGKRNESGYILLIAEKLAEVKEMGIRRLCEITNQNAAFIFRNKVGE